MYSIIHITSNKEHTWSAKKYHGKCLQLEKATQTANIVSLCTCNLLMFSITICLKYTGFDFVIPVQGEVELGQSVKQK